MKENGFNYYDAITLDSQLGDGTGLETVIEINREYENIKEEGKREEAKESSERQRNNNKISPIISISGDDLDTQKEIYKDIKISRFIQKPISKQLLLDTIISVIYQ